MNITHIRGLYEDLNFTKHRTSKRKSQKQLHSDEKPYESKFYSNSETQTETTFIAQSPMVRKEFRQLAIHSNRIYPRFKTLIHCLTKKYFNMWEAHLFYKMASKRTIKKPFVQNDFLFDQIQFKPQIVMYYGNDEHGIRPVFFEEEYVVDSN